MDEVTFHLMQRIETFQIWLAEITQRSLELVETTAQEVLASEQYRIIQEGFKEIVTCLSESWAEAVDLLTRVSYPKLIIASISSFVGNDINRGTLTACCFGFTVGSGLGLALGFCLQAPSKPIYMMRAIAATNFTGPDGIAVLEDVPIPTIKSPDQILVEVRFATLCQTDLRISSGYSKTIRSILDHSTEPPVILGRSGSGTVVEVGGAVEGIDPGDKVIFWCPVWRKGCLSQYVCLSSWQVVSLPKGVSLEDGAWSAYPSVLSWRYIQESGISTRELHSKRVFVHCGSNWVGDALRRTLITHGCEASATTSQTPVGSDNPGQFFHLSAAPLLMTDPLHRHRYDLVFNTEGEAAEEFCRCLLCPKGKIIGSFPPYFYSDTFGSFIGFAFSLWLRMTHRPTWELSGMREGSRLVRSLGRAPQPQSPHALDPSMVAISSVGAVLVSINNPPQQGCK
ncbi:uncharacterized protein [Halyomorpha halys]|uniref:uncharacterized protein isoform X2 n=1 Tax=Halyomorpha halys TaxID=286706 RepID=UPI0006D51ECC|nr:uncharacterized protein LOC106680706 isoform X2 [Halyomorpha halys]